MFCLATLICMKLNGDHTFSGASIMRAAWFVVSVLLAVGFLAKPTAGAGSLDEAALRHEWKMTYCREQRGKRFYKSENLEDLCVLKVAVFEDLVSGLNYCLVTWPNFASQAFAMGRHYCFKK